MSPYYKVNVFACLPIKQQFCKLDTIHLFIPSHSSIVLSVMPNHFVYFQNVQAMFGLPALEEFIKTKEDLDSHVFLLDVKHLAFFLLNSTQKRIVVFSVKKKENAK